MMGAGGSLMQTRALIKRRWRCQGMARTQPRRPAHSTAKPPRPELVWRTTPALFLRILHVHTKKGSLVSLGLWLPVPILGASPGGLTGQAVRIWALCVPSAGGARPAGTKVESSGAWSLPPFGLPCEAMSVGTFLCGLSSSVMGKSSTLVSFKSPNWKLVLRYKIIYTAFL